MDTRRTYRVAVLGLLPLQIVVKAIDGAFPVLLAFWFGRSDRTDVYYFASAVFALAGSVVFSAFQDSAVVPVLAELRRTDPAALPVVRGSLLAHTLAFGGALALGFGSLATLWFSLRYEGDARTLAVRSMAPFGVYLVALSLKTFYASMLNAEHRYFPAPLAGAVGAVVTLAVVAAGRTSLSIVAIPIASAAGELTTVTLLALSARYSGIAIEPTFARPEPVRRIARLVAAEAGGGAVTRINPVIDQLMAGLAGVAGGGTLLKLSGDIASVPTSLLQAVLLPVLLTHLSDDVADGDTARFHATLRRTLAVVLGTLSACTAALWFVRAPLLHALLAHGAMDPRGVDRLIRLLPYHLVGLAPFGALLVLARAHVAVQNSRIMFSMGVLNALLNATLDVAFVRGLGVEGLALATSVTCGCVALVFAVRLRAPFADLDARAAAAADRA